jgi:branched-chain amino acid transport system substrate-binding protein
MTHRPYRTQRHTLALASCASVVLIAVTGCSSGSDTSTASGDSAPNPATDSPILIGYANTEKGAQANPAYSAGVDAAVTWINGNGGIEGHVLELDTCLNDGTPAVSVSCATQFVSNEAVAVLDGIDLGVDAMVPTLEDAGIPVFGTLFQGTKAAASPDFYQVAPAFVSTYTIALSSLADQGSENVAVISLAGNQASTQLYDSVVKPAAADLGISSRYVTYDAASPNFTSVIATLRAEDVDGALFIGNEELCNGFGQAAVTSGFKEPVLMGTCTDFVPQLGARAEGLGTVQTFYPLSMVPEDLPAQVATDLEQFTTSMTAADKDELVNNAFALWGYATTIDLVRMLETVDGEITSGSAAKAISGTKDLTGFAGDTIDCASRTAADGAACTTGLLVLTASSDETFTLVGGGYTAALGTDK